MTAASFTVCVVGANGLVGGTIISLLHEREFPLAELRKVSAADADASSFVGADIVFLATSDEKALTLAPLAVEQGAIVIDHSGAWRLQAETPLVVPEINGGSINRSNSLISIPNCTVPGVAMVIDALNKHGRVTDVVVTTMQSASGAGRAGLKEYLDNRDIIAQCETFLKNGYTTEEEKLLYETRKVLGDPKLNVTMTCVRVPVEVGHAASMLISFDEPISLKQAQSAFAAYPNIEVIDNITEGKFPTATTAANQDTVQVGRLRLDHQGKRLWVWQVCDNLRKGAALNAVQIIENLFLNSPATFVGD